MADTITVREAVSGNPVAKNTAVHIDLVGSESNTPLYTPAVTTPEDGDTGPSQPNIKYRLMVDAPAGVDDAFSPVFTPSSDFKYSWDGYIFPAAGSFTVRCQWLDGDTWTTIAALNTAVTVS